MEIQHGGRRFSFPLRVSMSTQGDLQQVRERVLQMARQIEELSRSNLPPDQFFPEFLRLLVRALGAQAGVVWMLDPNNRLVVKHEQGLSRTGFRDNPQATALNHELLTNVIATGESASYSPADDLAFELPTAHLHVLAALQVDNNSVGAVQVFQRPDAPPDARPGFLQFVEQMSGYASRFLERREAEAGPQTPKDFWSDFEKLTLQLQRTTIIEEVAGTAANDGRLLLGCDRVSVAVKRGRKVAVKAISGQDSVNARANLVRAMVDLSSKVMAMRETILFTGRLEQLPPQIEVPLADFIQESSARMVLVIPLFEYDPLVPRDADDEDRIKRLEPTRVIGALIVEQVNNSEPPPGLQQKAELLADHVSAGLQNALAYKRVFLLGLWRFFGRILEWFHGRKLAKTLAVLAVIAAFSLSLVYIPYDYRVKGTGRLMPVTQRAVFAMENGEVEEIFVEDGDRVTTGQKLLRIRNEDLELQYQEVKSEREVTEERYFGLGARMAQAEDAGNIEEFTSLRGQREQERIKLQGLQKREQQLKERVDRLTVRAPIDGLVVTFRLEELLKNRPVSRGETLLELMDETGDWHLEVEVPEKRMGHILRAQESLQTEHLEVEFFPATSPIETYEGRLEEISTRSETSEEGAVVELVVSTDAENDPALRQDLRVGAEVTAKINCGKKSLGYVWFGDVIEAAQRWFFVWF